MAYENLSESLLDYYPCRYGKSKLLFRGPKRQLDQKYIAFLGGTKTYGKFIEQPYVSQFEQQTGIMAVNLGCINAGIDVYVNDYAVLEVCSNAEVTVVQILGAHNMSNRLYSVHPRRNDRFVRASTLLQTIYREVDFTEYNFTHHLLSGLKILSPDRFEIVRRELKEAWVARMRSLLTKIEGRKLLLWVSEHRPEDNMEAEDNLGGAPLFVDREMLNALGDYSSGCLELVMPHDEFCGNASGMLVSSIEEPAALEMMPVLSHAKVCAALAPMVTDLMNQKGPRNRRAL